MAANVGKEAGQERENGVLRVTFRKGTRRDFPEGQRPENSIPGQRYIKYQGPELSGSRRLTRLGALQGALRLEL